MYLPRWLLWILWDKYLAVKSSITIYVAQLRGNNVIFSLINNRRTLLFMSSLYPIALKIGLKEYVKGLRNNSDKILSPNSRSILTNIFPLVKGLSSNILNYVRNAFKKLPRYMIIQVITQHQTNEHKEEHPKTCIVCPYRHIMSERSFNKVKSSKDIHYKIQFSALLCGVGSNGLVSPPPGFFKNLNRDCLPAVQSTRLKVNHMTTL